MPRTAATPIHDPPGRHGRGPDADHRAKNPFWAPDGTQLVIAHVDFDSRKRARDDAVALRRQ
jgi:hypothetical protein